MNVGLCGRPARYFFVLGKVSLGVLGRNSSGFTSWNCGSSMRSSRLVAPLASSASVSGTLEEGLLDGGKRPGKRTVAGEDQDKLVDPAILADPDSCFCEFRGVNIHHKSSSLPPMSLLHGFGASVYSWDRVMKHLGQITGSKVLAFDRPAIGLTSRVSPANSSSGSQKVKPLNPCSMAFSVLATLYFMDFLATQKAILFRHSASSLVAVETYFQSPERVAALILVAPAINAPRGKKRESVGKQLPDRKRIVRTRNQDESTF